MGLAVEHAYRRVPETLGRILDIKPPVDSLERMNVKMAQRVGGFRQSRPAPEPEAEGALCVVSADGKGVPIRRHAPEVPIAAHDRDPKPKTNRKKMAVVGAVYTIDPFVRTPEEIVDSLFRDPDREAPRVKRPEPQHKRLWASLPHDQDGEITSATDETFAWLAQEVVRRNPKADTPTVWLMDGQKSLWEAAQRDLPSDNTVEILDLLHATPRIWEAAHLFYDRDSDGALDFVKDRMERSGMRWTIESAQAMWDVRSTYLNGDWDAFMAYRIEKENQRLYPYRELVDPIDMPEETELSMAA